MGEKIINRMKPCTCGCKGSDPWHARYFDRVVHDVTVLDEVTTAVTAPFGRDNIIARGTVKLPRGETKVGFVAYQLDGRDDWYRLGWCVLEEV